MMDITRYMDLTLKPIPRRHPIPPGSVALLEQETGYADVGPIYVISKNRQEIAIETPPIEESFTGNGHEQYLWAMKWTKYYLAVIEDLLPTIEFGTTNWAYLVPDQYEGFRIVHSQKELQRVSCPTWAPIICVDEVEITAWGRASNRRGIWKGKEVDIILAWNDTYLWLVNRAMRGLRCVDGHDVTFELYGHLVDRDGHVVGLVSEAAWGRQVGLGDEDFVKKELKRLESLGCIYRACSENQFLIAGGRLRLLQLDSILPISDQERLKKEAALIHDAGLDDLFEEFRAYGPYGYCRTPPNHLTNSYERLTYIRLNPTPRRSLSQGLVYSVYFLKEVTYCDDHNVSQDQRNKPASLALAIHRRKPQRDALRMVYSSRNKSSTDSSREGRPLGTSKAISYSLLLGSTPHSYYRPSKVLKKLTETDSSQGTLDTDGC